MSDELTPPRRLKAVRHLGEHLTRVNEYARQNPDTRAELNYSTIETLDDLSGPALKIANELRFVGEPPTLTVDADNETLQLESNWSWSSDAPYTITVEYGVDLVRLTVTVSPSADHPQYTILDTLADYSTLITIGRQVALAELSVLAAHTTPANALDYWMTTSGDGVSDNDRYTQSEWKDIRETSLQNINNSRRRTEQDLEHPVR